MEVCQLVPYLLEVIWLVVWNKLYIYIYWECHHPQLTSYFFRGVGTPPTSYVYHCLTTYDVALTIDDLPLRISPGQRTPWRAGSPSMVSCAGSCYFFAMVNAPFLFPYLSQPWLATLLYFTLISCYQR
jgi:hypothetical protein